jgi:hypothetical protein
LWSKLAGYLASLSRLCALCWTRREGTSRISAESELVVLFLSNCHFLLPQIAVKPRRWLMALSRPQTSRISTMRGPAAPVNCRRACAKPSQSYHSLEPRLSCAKYTKLLWLNCRPKDKISGDGGILSRTRRHSQWWHRSRLLRRVVDTAPADFQLRTTANRHPRIAYHSRPGEPAHFPPVRHPRNSTPDHTRLQSKQRRRRTTRKSPASWRHR